MSDGEKKKYILYDSVISLSLVTENVEKKRALYMMRMESLEEKIHLRKCNPLSDFCLIKESLFIIRHMRESEVEENVEKNPAESSVELNYNQHFVLQHMVSKKFLSKDKLSGNNNYQLKLVEKDSLAIPFTFKKIVDTRSSQNTIEFNQIVYLSAYIKEKAQYYYVNQLGPKNKFNVDFSDLIVEKDFTNKFVIINQECYDHEDGYLYSGDLINITFQEKQQLNEKSFMIGVECQKEVKTGELIALKEEVKEDIDNLVKDNVQQQNDILDYKIDNKAEQGTKYIKSYNLKNELFQHMNHFCFWIIEEENFSNFSKTKRTPLTAESYVRIKNPILNMYLKIKKKPPIEGMINQQDEYEFELVDEKNLMSNLLFISNFQIFHYSINYENKNLIDNGKYVIKSIFKEFRVNDPDNHFDINSINSYFEPISLSPSSDDKLIVKKGEEFIFGIKKVNIYKGNEAIYLKRIVEHLDYLIKSYNKKCYNQSNVIDVISKHLTFFTNYLMNLDYSFMDINLETNYPVPSRQNLLRKFKILDIITQIVYYFLPTIKQQKDKEKKQGDKNEPINLGLRNLMQQVLKFLTYLSQDNEKIKQEIFCGMKNLLDLCEFLFQKDRTILLNFIFVILKGSNALQECVLGSNTMLINSFKNRKQNLSASEKENLIKIDKIFSYLETSQNYLYFYKKIISFDKVAYKKEDIFKKIKEHIKKVENDYENDKNIRNYKSLLFKRVDKINEILDDPLISENLENEQLRTEIKMFLTFFRKFNFNTSLFLTDYFTDELVNKSENESGDYIDKKLQFIIHQNIKPEKFIGDLNIDVKSELAPLFPLHFFNKFFPKVPEESESENSSEESVSDAKNQPSHKPTGMINANLDRISQMSSSMVVPQKRKSGVNVPNLGLPRVSSLGAGLNQSKDHKPSSSNIHIPKLSDNNVVANLGNLSSLGASAIVSHQLTKRNYGTGTYNNMNNENNAMMKKREKELKTKLKKYLCIIYSTYQFYINQFFEANYIVFKTLKNICVNFETFGDLNLVQQYLEFVRNHLLMKVKFLEQSGMTKLYENVIRDPTIFKSTFCTNVNDNFISSLKTNEEIYEVKFLFKYCRNFDKINFFLEKLSLFRKIRQLLQNPSKNYREEFMNVIVKNLNQKRQKYLSLYQSLNREKEKLIQLGIFNTGSMQAYLIQKRIKFVTNLLGKCDIANYFNKIIYIKTEDLLSHFKRSSFEFKNIKVQIEKIHNENDQNVKNENESNKASIASIINSLNEISKQFKAIFGVQKKTFTIDPRTGTNLNATNQIEAMLFREDGSYFRKIDFPKEMKKMIKVINSFSLVEKGNVLKLEYCKEILRIFKLMSNNYTNFHKLIKDDIDTYIELITKSLETVRNYISDKYNDKENERINLSIIYNSAASFLYIVKNSKIPFSDLKTQMTRIFKLFLDIYQDLPPDLRVIYQISYTYLVSRVLLFLNKDKAYDFYYYEMFYQSIFPLKEIRNRIIDCVKELDLVDSTNEPENNEEENSNKLNSSDYSQREPSHKSDTSKSITDKMEKLIFLNFITAYTIYLNELNTARQSGSGEKKAAAKFKFKNLQEKIKLILDTSLKITDDAFNKNDSLVDGRDSINKVSTINQFKIMNQMTNTLFNTNNNQSNEDAKYKTMREGRVNNDAENDYDFESLLLESILFYKYEKKVIEICINDYQRDKKYYYNTGYIDLLLVEKILKDIDLADKVRQYFGEEMEEKNTTGFSGSDERSADDISPMQVLMQHRVNYNLKMSCANEVELFYDILHNEYLESEMMKYLDGIAKTLTKTDTDPIIAMRYFVYVKMNEMHQIGVSTSNEISTIENNSLIEELMELDEKNEIGDDEIINTVFFRSGGPDEAYTVDLNKIFNSIMYLYPQYNKNLTILIYKSSFNLLLRRCLDMRKQCDEGVKESMNFEEIIGCLVGLFKREINQTIILDKSLFFVVLNTIVAMLKFLKKEKINFVIKNVELFKNLFSYFDFIFGHLAANLESTVSFMKDPESHKVTDKFQKKVDKLKKIVKFISNVFKFNSIKEVNIFTEKMKVYNSKIVQNIIKLIFILLEYNNVRANPIILLLIDFLNNFIQGPDIENLDLLFSQGYFDLMKYAITNIDYYQIFLNNVNRDTLYDSIDNIIEIEYKIMKIFFIYFNIAHNDKKYLDNYINVRKFYEENFEKIKNKLKRIYYISTKEMEDRKFDIDKMLLGHSGNDFYSNEELLTRAGVNEESIYVDSSSSKKNKKELEDKVKVKEHKKSKHKDFCLMKFEIILVYYTLYIQQTEVMFENYFSIISSKKSIFDAITSFFYRLFMFILNCLMSPYYLVKLFISCSKAQKISKISLFEKLYDIDEKYQKVSEKEMMEYMKRNITSAEVYLDDMVYKIFFPILTKSKKIKENPNSYIHVESDQLQNYIYHIMNNYDVINIEATQNLKVDRVLETPVVRVVFLNLDLFRALSLINGFITNFLIMASYSDYNDNVDCGKENPRLSCPYLWYEASAKKQFQTNKIFNAIGIIQVIITIFLFINYYMRKFSTQLKKTEYNFKITQVKINKKRRLDYGWWPKLIYIYLPTIFNSFINFESLFYILSLSFSILGLLLHPFFFGFMLVEFIVRTKVMRNVLLSVYVPSRQVLITFILVLILEYYFALFALTYFKSHFPLQTDTKNFFKTFMRVFDQTFKQDGGVGTYLDKSLEEGYVPYIPRAFVGLRFWFDNIFYFFILVLMFQMFLSIIKDYFSSQREEQMNFTETVERRCLICGIDREVIEKIYFNQKNAFDIHTNHDHNVSDYICYMNYLQSISKRDKIIEENVWQLHLKNNYFFLPKNTCFKLRERKNMDKSMTEIVN